MTDCIFCRIARGEIPSSKVYEDDGVLAFRDIQPSAPVHILVIPKLHVASVVDPGTSPALLAQVMAAVQAIARQEGLDNGFRLISNTGPDANQEVHHLHFHILGGRKLGSMG